MEPTPQPPAQAQPDCAAAEAEAPRRNFLVKFAAVVIGGIVTLVPFLSGLLFFLDPLRRKGAVAGSSGGGGDLDGFIKVGNVDSLPENQTPVMFRVIADRTDAWNLFPKEPIGAVHVRKTETGQVVAFNVLCPHLGCPVDFRPSQGDFYCPCHNSNFSLDGEAKNAIPPRGLDTLDVHPGKLAEGEIWVKFQNFKTGEHTKIPRA